MVMTFFDVILRSVFNSPIEEATELTRILMAVIVFSVLPVISSRGDHIAVDLADSLFDRFRLDRARNAVVFLFSAVLLYWPTERVWILAERARDYGDVTEYLAIPQFYIGWFIAASLLITALTMFVTGLLHAFAPHLLREQSA
jgi:TRAP-type C4-dicarboxylate transport system permease small subunit